MINRLKRLRLLYSLYNFFQKKKLEHNLPLYRKYGLSKNYYDSVSSKDFQHLVSVAEEDVKPLSSRLEEKSSFQRLSPQDKNSVANFDRNGYAVLRNFFSAAEVDEANRVLEELLQKGSVSFNSSNKIMFAYRKAEALRKLGKNEDLLELLAVLLRTTPILFQSINFLKGSEQETHSDSIHMTTYPLGRLIAVWIALEDIDEDNGPLHYYPGSHLLPYYLNSDYGNEGNRWLIGDKTYDAYEHMIRKKIHESGLEKKVFTAKKGDLLIWHANLAHGGEPHTNKSKTRKSMVFHYFGDDAICYHEITQRPALMDLE